MQSFTGVGNVVADPQLHTNGNTPRATFTMAFNEAPRDGVEAEATFVDVTVFGDLAHNVAATLRKGMHAFVHGRLRGYKVELFKADGSPVSVGKLALTAFECGPSVRFATAQVTKVARADAPSAQPAQAVYADPAAQAVQGQPTAQAAPAQQPPQAVAEPVF